MENRKLMHVCLTRSITNSKRQLTRSCQSVKVEVAQPPAHTFPKSTYHFFLTNQTTRIFPSVVVSDRHFEEESASKKPRERSTSMGKKKTKTPSLPVDDPNASVRERLLSGACPPPSVCVS